MRRILIVLVAAAAASACGSGGSSNLTKSEYVSKADDVCKLYRIKLQHDAQATRHGIADPSVRAKYDRATVVSDYRAELASLKTLKPPKADQQQVDAALTQLQSAIDDLDGKLQSNPSAAYASSYDPFRTAYNGLKQYGTTQCDSPVTS
jgi:hypothetical protein